MKNFIHNVPKAELHTHIEGAMDPELMFEIAAGNKIKLPYKSVEELYCAYEFQGIQSFLKIYHAMMEILHREQDFYNLTWNYLERAVKQNIRYAEIIFEPQIHLRRGVSLGTIIYGIHDALIDGEKKLGITSKMIMNFLPELGAKEAVKTLQEALPFKKRITGIGLSLAENSYPLEEFQPVFDKAGEQGIFRVAYSGKANPEAISQALNLLKITSIDQGIRCMENESLVARMIAQKVPLTVCPLADVKLQVIKNMGEHPLKRMLDKKLLVTVNSAYPAYMGGYLEENMSAIQSALHLTKADIYQLVKNSFEASLLDAADKQQFIAAIDDYYLTTSEVAEKV